MEGFIHWFGPIAQNIFEALGLNGFWQSNKRIHVLYLAAAVLLAAFYYLFFYKNKKQKSVPQFFQYLFPKKIWLHQSAIIDYQLFLLNNLLKFFLLAPYVIAHTAFAYIVVRWWDSFLGVQDSLLWSTSSINLLYTFVFLIVSDFSRFLLHYSMHKIPFLWQFHKVHHAAEVMTPMTLYRVHPVEYCILRLRSLLVFGLVTGSFFFWFRTAIVPYQILNIHIGLFLFNMLGANLRHSHVPISFGKTAEHLIISPAQHQIHHGKETRYFDKNFGSFLAIWDWLFGSLSISRKEKIAFGIETEDQKEFKSLQQNIMTPFLHILKNKKN